MGVGGGVFFKIKFDWPIGCGKEDLKKDFFSIFCYCTLSSKSLSPSDAFCQVWPVGCMNGSGEDFLIAKVFLLFRHTCFSTPCLSYKGTCGI